VKRAQLRQQLLRQAAVVADEVVEADVAEQQVLLELRLHRQAAVVKEADVALEDSVARRLAPVRQASIA
jgi:hypothetical protein